MFQLANKPYRVAACKNKNLNYLEHFYANLPSFAPHPTPLPPYPPTPLPPYPPTPLPPYPSPGGRGAGGLHLRPLKNFSWGNKALKNRLLKGAFPPFKP